MSKFFNLTFAAALVVASAAPAAFAQDSTADASETAAVQAALNHDFDLRFDHVRVQTVDGVVYLHGTVGSYAEAEHAEALARAVPNVGEVVDTLSDNDPS